MKHIKHDELYDYILGLSDDTQAKKVEQQLEESATLRAEAALLREALSDEAAGLSAAEPSNSMLASIIDAVTETRPFDGFIARLADFLDLDCDQVVHILDQIQHHDSPWVQSGIPGITYLKVKPGPARSGQECQLVRMEPNVRFPHHGHQSDEWGFVIQGEVIEDSGEVYLPGDIVFKDQASRHSFVASGNQPFLFFVIHGGLEFD